MAKLSFDGTQKRPSFVASDHYTTISVTIDSSARDENNSTPTDLRAGCLLVADSSLSGGKYTVLKTDGTGANIADIRSAVVLLRDIYGIDEGDQEAAVLFHGEVYETNIYYNGSAALSDTNKDAIQRIMFL